MVRMVTHGEDGHTGKIAYLDADPPPSLPLQQHGFADLVGVEPWLRLYLKPWSGVVTMMVGVMFREVLGRESCGDVVRGESRWVVKE